MNPLTVIKPLAGAVSGPLMILDAGDIGGTVAKALAAKFAPHLDEDTKDHGENVVAGAFATVTNGMDGFAHGVSGVRDGMLGVTKDIPVIGGVARAAVAVGNVAGGIFTDITHSIDGIGEMANKLGGVTVGAKQVRSDRGAKEHIATKLGVDTDEVGKDKPVDELIAERGLGDGLMTAANNFISGFNKTTAEDSVSCQTKEALDTMSSEQLHQIEDDVSCL